MPLWIELMVAALIAYGAAVSLTLAWFSRRRRLSELRRVRARREAAARGDKRNEDKNDG